MLRGALRIAASTTASASAVSADAAAVMQPLKKNILELSKPELQSALSGMGLPAFKAKQARTGGRARAHGPRNRYAFMLAHALRADRRHTRHACGHTLSLSSPKLGSYWRHRVASPELGLRRCGTGSITAALGLSATCSSARRYGSSFLTVAL